MTRSSLVLSHEESLPTPEKHRMTIITDEYMKHMMMQTKNYSVVILKATAKRNEPGAEKVVWEHGRRNFSLRAEGVLSIVCPVAGSTDVRGIGIFNATTDEVEKIMDEDPGVKAGVFVYEVYACRSFPGDALPQ